LQPTPRKMWVECPQCKRLEVSVPWGLDRKRELLWLAGMWATYLGWLAAALLTRNLWLWLAPFIVHLGITLAAGWASYRNAREYRCLGCGYRWR